LVLASSSPQRLAILERLGVTFTVRATDVPERSEGDPPNVARENALRKEEGQLMQSLRTKLRSQAVVEMNTAALGPQG